MRRSTIMTGLMLWLASAGCGDGLPVVPDTSRLGQLTFRGGVNVAESFPVQLGFFLDVRNVSERDLRVASDGCGVLPRAWTGAERSGEPRWDTRPEGLSREPCRASVAATTIPAGESLRLTRSYGAADVLGDSLPDGRYYFSVTYRASVAGSEEVRLVEVTAGDAKLVLPR